jgi:hypothetical protein
MNINRSASFGFLAIVLATSCSSLNAQAPEDGKGGKDLAQQLLGAWVLVGEPGDVGEPQPGARMKFWGEKHWVITEPDPNTGKTVFHHGGTYTLDGDKYVETIKFANENTAHLIGKELRFRIKVEGDTYTQVGDGNPYTEVWKRLSR